MGNSLGSKRAAKVMKINGETMKLKIPIHAGNVIENHPGHVLLESEAVKHFGIRAKPLDPSQELKPKGLYFLVELPKFPTDDDDQKTSRPTRVHSSGIHMTAKDRLESLMLSKRSASDLSNMKPAAAVASSSSIVFDDAKDQEIRSNNDKCPTTRLKLRIPKSEVEKLMMQCKDEDDVAAKIVEFCMENHVGMSEEHVTTLNQQHEKGIVKSHEKRVGFRPVTEAEIRLAVAS